MNIRQLKCELAKAGFTCLKGRGKGSHTVWKHPDNNTIVVYSGRARSQAKPYQLKTLSRFLNS